MHIYENVIGDKVIILRQLIARRLPRKDMSGKIIMFVSCGSLKHPDKVAVRK